MSEQTEVIVTATPPTTKQPDPLQEVRQLAYAWVGLWGVAAEDLGKFYQRCVERGEQIMNTKAPAPQPEVKPALDDTVSPAPDEAGTEPKKKAAKITGPMSIFNAFGAVESYHIDLNAEELLPTKQEVEALIERVEALAREVEALTKQRAA